MKNLCIIFGGPTPEYDVSLSTATHIIGNANREKFRIIPVGISRSGVWYHYTGAFENIATDEWLVDTENLTPIVPADLVSMGVDVVFPASHGNYCEDGQLQAELEAVGVPFVGSSSAASALCMNKSATKARMDELGVKQAAYMVVNSVVGANSVLPTTPSATLPPLHRGELSTYPLFVKPSSAGSSIGISKVSTPDQLESAIQNALKYDDIAIIEQGIIGREVEVAILEASHPVGATDSVARGRSGSTAPTMPAERNLIVSTCGEIVPGSDFYCYDTKYVADTASYHIPANISEKCSDKIRQLAMEIFIHLGCRGLARIDFFVTSDEEIIFNEINTIPGFTPISMYPKLLMRGGLTYADVIELLVEGAIFSD